MNNSKRMRPRVIILGAGFGGLWAAKKLARSRADVLVIDSNNYHLFLPLLYQVAAPELGPEEIAYPIRQVLGTMPNISFLLSRATELNLDGRYITANDRRIPFDYLILGIGSSPNFFNTKGTERYAFPLTRQVSVWKRLAIKTYQ